MKKNKKPSSLSIFPFILFIITGFYIYRYFFLSIDTEIIKYGEMEDYFEAKAIVIRNEHIYSFPGNAQVINKVNEGERVSFGKKLADIVKSEEQQDDLQLKINDLERRIKEIENSSEINLFQGDSEKLKENIDEKIEYIKVLSNQGNIEKISEVKEQLSSDLNKKSLISGDKSFSGKNLNQLKAEKEQLQKLYNEHMDTIYASSPGIVSYNIDGLEQNLNPENIAKFSVQDVKSVINSLKDDNNKDAKHSGVKIIDNFSWYICMIIGEKQLKGLEEGKKVQIAFKNYESVPVRAKIKYISEPDNGEVLVSFETTDNMQNYYNMRLADVKVITNQFEGFLVSEESVVEIDNQKGVYIIREGIVKFVPAEVIATENGYALIKNIENKENAVSGNSGTIKVYDEVVKDTGKVKPNQRVL
ncbi:HlyD family efflux transporter periplasmic adaptor subunit [Lutispora thermophila]|uniref:Putative membrane fusion protein n=1 Tax=Lutispora thermophila DSM 19022 TaxID=1122184 RepID=A0A1M6G253_9FIRM|nr:HlyD family efflux transporter periplasmic adaptor subunit [Lutispora thermophila]SHJ03947.1 putative membrane fusion protein [Lutispora thermophila DSM 19022]